MEEGREGVNTKRRLGENLLDRQRRIGVIN